MSLHFVSHIQKLASGQTLSASETQALFSWLDERDVREPPNGDDLYYLTAVVALMARGPTTDELFGIVDDIATRSIDLTERLGPFGSLVDISGTGGDSTDTPNVGSLASFVSAAGGVSVAKQATRAFTGVSGSAEVYGLLGWDVMTANVDDALDLLRTIGVTAVHTPTLSGLFTRRSKVLRRLRDLDLTFVTPWHLVSWLYSPFPLTGRVYGVCDDNYRNAIADILRRRWSNQHALVVHGRVGIDEISVSGSTQVTEVRNGGQYEFTVTPESLGLPAFSEQEVSVHAPDDFESLTLRSLPDAIRCEINARASESFSATVFAILNGEGHPAHEALIAANAGAALYVGGKVKSLADGAAMALELLRSGAARETARRFAQACGNIQAATELRPSAKLS